jgi:hypothetical protein
MYNIYCRRVTIGKFQKKLPSGYSIKFNVIEAKDLKSLKNKPQQR